jgi:hypothetical protein
VTPEQLVMLLNLAGSSTFMDTSNIFMAPMGDMREINDTCFVQ